MPGAFTLAAVLERPRLTATFLFLMPALKQYALAPPLLGVAAMARRAKWGGLVLGAAVALATIVPFVVWSPSPPWSAWCSRCPRRPTRA